MHIPRSLLTNRLVAFFLRRLCRYGWSRRGLERLAGFRRPFATMEEAREAAEKIGMDGHEDQSNITLHLRKAEWPRVSDYPVLFRLQQYLPSVTKVLDLGGNVGNLFYLYEKYIQFPKDLTWTVYDLPGITDAGRKLANERQATNLRFVDQVNNLEQCDVLLVSGAMHYLEPPLLESLRQSSHRPKWVVINRVPLSGNDTFYTVQKDVQIAVACRVENLESLKSGIQELGYHLTDHWQVSDRNIILPLFPDYSVHYYTGLIFAMRN